ncbi:hypothetical protein [Alicyclobacillus acidoterrestris]|uniref:Uncharacterized protein n=1 Tax=Alicyclobacillus acidoterrestris (strain ATCC 49025 / DSM 3922 / CIP 106132 / NCIMB 13137 / GD3B) TaxID=1356854 RepID=T0BZ78_ALIAG|nr:hypothetical protein [Alicyclobacillus acidoterrestris]EPZ45715.1 hypothetical protein N007_08035 [Alicyclobacillus acidoterrestris ATCC 49025]UNO50010.1 hypothetical protein K1I37_05825 [Alicyclobacillus acidoterrestris]
MGKRHLYEIDLMRAFIMLAVLSVHTTSFFLSMSKHMANTLLMAACTFVLPHVHYAKLPTVIANADRYRSEIFLTYQFWFVAGGILACHYDNVCAFIKRHSRLVLIALCCAVPVVWAHYLFDRLILHEVESISEAVLQPIMVPYSLLVTAILWYAGIRWSVRRLEARWLSKMPYLAYLVGRKRQPSMRKSTFA